jgi:hypothetical protein
VLPQERKTDEHERSIGRIFGRNFGRIFGWLKVCYKNSPSENYTQNECNFDKFTVGETAAR